MKFVSVLIAVKDMSASKRFYRELFGLEVVSDFGANVVLEGGIALQTVDSWKGFIGGKDVTLPNNAVELYFEEWDFDAFLERLSEIDVKFVHKAVEHGWGQRVVRFYDPDGHIIEVGEDMSVVVRRFKDGGMTDEQVAERMDVPLEYILKIGGKYGI